MRTTKEILELMLSEMHPDGRFFSGLCLLASTLRRQGVLSDDDEDLVKEYINKHAPAAVWHGQTRKGYTSNLMHYCWKARFRQGRINWLKKHIKLNS